MHNRIPWFFAGDLWYRSHGSAFIVAYPPVGLVIPFLPYHYRRLGVGSRVYYLADDVYYDRVDDGYRVTEPPETDGEVVELYEAPAGEPGASPLVLYADSGQSDEQIARDKLRCENWAAGKTGFDPELAQGGMDEGSYADGLIRFQSAVADCLRESGYRVN